MGISVLTGQLYKYGWEIRFGLRPVIKRHLHNAAPLIPSSTILYPALSASQFLFGAIQATCLESRLFLFLSLPSCLSCENTQHNHPPSLQKLHIPQLTPATPRYQKHLHFPDGISLQPPSLLSFRGVCNDHEGS